MITPASQYTCDLVKRAAIQRLLDKGLPLERANQLYDLQMDKLAFKLTNPLTDDFTTGPKTNTPNTSIQPVNVNGNVSGTNGTLNAANNNGSIDPSTLAQGNFNNKVKTPNQPAQDVNQIPARITDPNNPGYRPPGTMDVAQEALTNATQPQSKMAQASVNTSERQLLICKAAFVMKCAEHDIPPYTALQLFNNTLNKHTTKLLKTAGIG